MDLVRDPDNSSVEPQMKTLQRPLTHLSVNLRVQTDTLSEYLGSRCLGHKRVELGARVAQGLEQSVE